MVKPKVTANSFLKNMGMGEAATIIEEAPASSVVEEPAPRRVAPAKRSSTVASATKPANGRVGLKHFGGYLERDTIEQIAILRARLDLDNSALIKQAIEELYNRETAARKFGDR